MTSDDACSWFFHDACGLAGNIFVAGSVEAVAAYPFLFVQLVWEAVKEGVLGES